MGDGTYNLDEDGKTGSANSLVARDSYDFSLNYFSDDYAQINTAVTAFGTVSNNLPNPSSDNLHAGSDLFNGNIRAMLVNIPKLTNVNLYGYRYDQLNRIVAMNTYNGVSTAINTLINPSLASQDYNERITYDANGNILGYLRNGAQAVHGWDMDSLTYKYDYYTSANVRKTYIPGGAVPADAARLTNRLNYVKDIGGGTYTEDIKDQNGNNYTYDKIGNLTSDVKENISLIEWTVYGKISHILKTDGSYIDYTYDASGNRITKLFRSNGISKTTFYVRDASGNVMSIYESGETAINGGDLTQTEIHLYGSSRLGIYNVSTDVQCHTTTQEITTFIRWDKFFELSNHLGNVLVTVSDKKIPHTTNGTTIDWYNADVVTANDYTPFGMQMVGRKYTASSSKYHYGFNGKESDNEVKGEGNQIVYESRMYDPRLGRLLSIDPLGKAYPWYSPYQFAGNDVIRCSDLLGRQPESKINDWNKGRKTTFLSGGTEYEIYDNTHHQLFDATGVYDPATGKTWVVAEDRQSGKYFYLVNDNNSTDHFKYKIENSTAVLYAGHFERFDTKDEKEIKARIEFAKNFEKGVVCGMAGAVAAPFVAAATATGLSAYLAGGTTTACVSAAFGDAAAAYGGAGAVVVGAGGIAAVNAMEAETGSSAISLDEAISRGSSFLKPNVEQRFVEQPSGLQVIQTYEENGNTITKRVGFDINPNSQHVQETGPHLNLQTQVNGNVVKKGPLADPHTPIKPSTITAKDYE